MRLIDFKYVFCPVLKKEIRLKLAYERRQDGKKGRKILVDCTGAMTCKAGAVKKETVVFDFSNCPFNTVRFIE